MKKNLSATEIKVFNSLSCVLYGIAITFLCPMYSAFGVVLGVGGLAGIGYSALGWSEFDIDIYIKRAFRLV